MLIKVISHVFLALISIICNNPPVRLVVLYITTKMYKEEFVHLVIKGVLSVKMEQIAHVSVALQDTIYIILNVLLNVQIYIMEIILKE